MAKISEDDRILKDFLDENFDFYTLRKFGFFPKEFKKKDIHKQEERISTFFGYKTVFEYNAHPTYAHISYGDGHIPMYINEQGELKTSPLVEKFGGWSEY